MVNRRIWLIGATVTIDDVRIKFQPLQVAAQPVDALRGCDRRDLRASGNQLCGLATGCRAQIDDMLSGNFAKKSRGEGGGGIDPPVAIGKTVKLGQVAIELAAD